MSSAARTEMCVRRIERLRTRTDSARVATVVLLQTGLVEVWFAH
jgi:hypothetical protein